MDEATLILRRVAGIDPQPRRKLALVHHLLAVGGPAPALAEIETLTAAQRQAPDFRALEAVLCGMLGDHDRQISMLEELTCEHPRNAGHWVSMGLALNIAGQTKAAVNAVRKAIAVRRSHGEAYWTLGNFKAFRFSDRDVLAMRRALNGKLTEIDRKHFHFALGKAFEDRRDFTRSFEHYAAGNQIGAARLRPEEMQVTPVVDLALAVFAQGTFDRPPPADAGAGTPIFVVGLHRSGSTLIEQVLASHPMIEGAGELPVMQQIFERLSRAAAQTGRDPFSPLAASSAATLEAIGNEYMARAEPFRRNDRPFFVDKLPANWLNLGLIRLALPRARIIDARRHPIACGFSNFKQHYAYGVNFSYSLSSIGQFYRDYLRMMGHFDAIQPGAVHHVINEQLIARPEHEIRRLLDYVGVPFDAACLDFHSNPRAVRTPSADQVRRPVNSDGVDLWRAYEPWLGPLKQALGPALTDWLPPD